MNHKFVSYKKVETVEFITLLRRKNVLQTPLVTEFVL